ncbi:hypothetical protein A6A29_34555 [Streptomyces sp. TSRI0281]|nr:hypothetical protein A6A29_34555 [Streptomyces sp. TSRI0281]
MALRATTQSTADGGALYHGILAALSLAKWSAQEVLRRLIRWRRGGGFLLPVGEGVLVEQTGELGRWDDSTVVSGGRRVPLLREASLAEAEKRRRRLFFTGG